VDVTRVRKLAVYALAILLLSVGPATGAFAQSSKDTPIVVGEGVGMYVQAAPPTVIGAFDRAMSEIDAADLNAPPRQVKDTWFRRRLLELRLVMDVNAFAYDKKQMKGYRDLVDRAYEASGVFQDIVDFEKELGITVAPEIVDNRRSEMHDALGPLRTPGVRNEMRRFFSSPEKGPRNGGGPRLWDLTGVVATNAFDATGNAALLQSGLLSRLQGSDLGINDIFDPDQAFYLHEVRKEMRSVVILSAMYPDTNAATREVVKPLVDLVDDYGDVLEAFNSYVFALQNGLDTSKVAPEVAREFERSQLMKNDFIDARALDAMAVQVNSVRDAHRR
jgi:hypothetical protein